MSAPASTEIELGEILLSTTRLEPQQLERARIRQHESRERLAEVLVEEGMLNAEEVMGAVAEQLGLEVRNTIQPEELDEELLKRVPITFAKQHRVLPLRMNDEGQVRVVAANALDTAPLDDLRILFGGSDIALELASERVILTAINQVYDRGATSTDQLAEEATDDLDALANQASHEPQDLLEATDDAPIIRLVNSLLQHAVKERASDIHIEPFEKEIRVRFRIDDVLYEPIRIRCRARCRPASLRASRSWAASTSPRNACPRTAASA